MLLFRSEEAVDAWCEATGESRGETLSLEQVWDLARVWYGNRMDPAFRGRRPEEVEAIFAGQGLTSDFWRVG